MAREDWWRATTWIDQLFFVPFYAVATYAFVKGKDWIRNWCFIWGSVTMTNVFIVRCGEAVGGHPTDKLPLVLALNARGSRSRSS